MNGSTSPPLSPYQSYPDEMYLPLEVNPFKTWYIHRIGPDKRVAPSASEEARKVKRGIARRHLKSLGRFEEELLQDVGTEAVDAIYNRLGLSVPESVPEPETVEDGNKKEANNFRASVTGTMRQNGVDYKTIQLARSRFHPVESVREQAAANLVLVEQQEAEEWKKNAANWGTTTTYCDIMDSEEAYLSGWTDDDPFYESDDSWDTDLEWSDVEKDEDDNEDDENARWEETKSPWVEEEDQAQLAGSEYHSAVDIKPSDYAVCDPFVGFPTPTPPPPEIFSPPSSHNLSRSSKTPSNAADELVMVLNDKIILNAYLSNLEEGIREARKTKPEKDADRRRASQYYSGPKKRPGQTQGWETQREREGGREHAEGETSLRWYEYEDMHIYNESSGQWELTVERRGRNYRLARASDTKTLNSTKGRTEDSTLGNQDWNTDMVPNWTGATGSGWFD